MFDISKVFNLTRFDGIIAENPPVTPSGMIIPLFYQKDAYDASYRRFTMRQNLMSFTLKIA